MNLFPFFYGPKKLNLWPIVHRFPVHLGFAILGYFDFPVPLGRSLVIWLKDSNLAFYSGNLNVQFPKKITFFLAGGYQDSIPFEGKGRI